MRIHPLHALFLMTALFTFLGSTCEEEENTPISGTVASFGLFEVGSWWEYTEVGNAANVDSLVILSDDFFQGDYYEGYGNMREQMLRWRGNEAFWNFVGSYRMTFWTYLEAERYGLFEPYQPREGTILVVDDRDNIFPNSDYWAFLRTDHSSFQQNGEEFGRTLEIEFPVNDTLLADSVPLLREIWIAQNVGPIRHVWTDSTTWELTARAVTPTVIQK